MRAVSVVLAAIVAGCGGSEEPSADGFPAEPLAVIESDGATLVLEVRTAPDQPPSRGVATVELRVHDGGGAPATALRIDADLWMPVHGHVASPRPESAETGDGRYLLTDVDLFMPGSWELRLELDGAVSDHAVVPFDVP